MLGGQPDLEVVGEAGDGQAGLAAGARAAPRRRADGHPDAAASTASTRPGRAARRPDPPHVIVLTTFDADELRASRRSPRAPTGSCSRTPRRREILEAIRAVADGDPMLSPSVTRTPDRAGPRRPDDDSRTEPRPGAARAPDRARARGRPGGRARAEQRRDRGASCTSRCRPSRRTSRGSSTSSRSPTGCRSRSACTTPGWSSGPRRSYVAPGVRGGEVTVVRRGAPRRACRRRVVPRRDVGDHQPAARRRGPRPRRTRRR